MSYKLHGIIKKVGPKWGFYLGNSVNKLTWSEDMPSIEMALLKMEAQKVKKNTQIIVMVETREGDLFPYELYKKLML